MHSFAKQYYSVFAENIEELHKLYSADSSMIFDSDQIAKGQDAIQERLKQLEIRSAVIDLKQGSIDCIESIDGMDCSVYIFFI